MAITALVVTTLAIVLGASGIWYISLAKIADRFISPIQPQLSGERCVRFTLWTRTHAIHPALQFSYDTIGMSPTIFPFVKVSVFGEVIESNPEYAWLDRIADTTETTDAEHDGGLKGLQP